MVVHLMDVMNYYEKKFNRLTDSHDKKAIDKAFKIADRWNKIRKIIEFQESQISLRRVS